MGGDGECYCSNGNLRSKSLFSRDMVMTNPNDQYNANVPQDFKCPACGIGFQVNGDEDNGMWNPHNEDDTKCPECGAEGELV